MRAASLSLLLLCSAALLCVGVMAQDQCNQAHSCGQCESMDAGYYCGWCPYTKTCSTGSSTGPAVGGCPGGQWSFQYCPTDNTCLNIGGDCNSCLQQANACYYCASSNSCQPGATGPIPNGATCNNIFSGSPSICSSSGGPDSPSYPTAGVVANVFLVITSLFWLLRMVLYCCTKGWTPVFGIRLHQGMISMINYTHGGRLAVPFFVATLSMALKLASLGVDRWDVFDFDTYGTGAPEIIWYWGLLRIHLNRAQAFPVGPAGPQTELLYSDFCKLFNDQPNDPSPDPSNSNSRAMCRTLRVAGILCLVMGILSIVCSALTALYGLCLLARQTTIPSKGILGWRIAGFCNMATIASFLYWIASAHVIIMHNLGDLSGDIWVGPSYWLMLGAWIVDFCLLIFMRRAVAFTPANGEGGLIVGAVPYAVLAPAPVGGFAHQQRQGQGGYAQGQPMQYAPPQQQQPQAAYNPYAVPQGYGAPQAGYGQPQPYVQQQQRGF